MKRSKRFTRTVEFLKRNPPARQIFKGQIVLIYSSEYRMFWRGDQAGYTPNEEEAGVYGFDGILQWLLTTGPEKKLKLQIVSEESQRKLAHKYSEYMREALYGKLA